jgi:hypothetical protein
MFEFYVIQFHVGGFASGKGWKVAKSIKGAKVYTDPVSPKKAMSYHRWQDKAEIITLTASPKATDV